MRSIRAIVLATVAAMACVRGGEVDEPARPITPAAYTGDELPPLSAQGAPVKGGTLRIAMDSEPPTLNYQLDPLDGWAKRLHELAYDSMARPNPRTFEHEPMLAERWEISPDRLTFTFYLRKGVTWHDGEPFDADDVVFTFEKILDPTSKTMAVRTFLEPLQKIEKVDAYTVRFTLARPYWLAFDAIAEIYIYPQHVFSKGDFNTHPNNRAPVGTGPFRFVHWKTGDEIVFERNPSYFRGAANLDRIVFEYVPDATVRMQMLRRGDLDVVLRISPELWKEAGEDAELARDYWRVRHVPSGLQWIGWNEGRPMFKDRRVRRALTMLIDRRDIVQNLRLGLDDPAVSWFYPGSKEYNGDVEAWPYDPDAARALLDEAGWKDTDGDGVLDKEGVRFSFSFLYSAAQPFYEQLAGLLVNELGKAGIEVKTTRVEWAVYTERLRRHEFDACSLLWQLEPRSDPYQIWHSGEAAGGSNFISYQSPEVDRLLVQAREEFDEGARVALYHHFSQILHEDEPYTMLFHRNNLSLISKRLGGVYSTPYGILPFAQLYLTQEEKAHAASADAGRPEAPKAGARGSTSAP